MKKTIFALAVILNCSFVIAQTEFDALKIVQPDINGTARYMGMAGAFGALGGDASAIKDNPAGIGVYRTSEASGTLNVTIQNSNSTWNATSGKDNLSRLDFTSFSFVKAIPTFNSLNSNYGLLSSNWSFSYNRLKNFNRNSTIKSGSSASSITDYMAYFTGDISSSDLSDDDNNDPYQNVDIPWISELAYQGYLINETSPGNTYAWSSLLNDGEMVTPTYTLQETGYLDEFSVGWAGNFSNMFYLGATLNLQSIDYTAQSRYSEEFEGGGRMALKSTVNTSGTGFNLNIGTIIRPTDIVRLGVSVHTPTIYSLTDYNYSNLEYYINETTHGHKSTPTEYFDYELNNSWKFISSAALVIGQKGLISAEYDYSMNSNAKFYDEDGNKQSFTEENDGIKDMLKDVHTIKIGGEYRLTNNISLRAGYAYMSGGTNNSKADKLMRYNTTRTDTEYFQNKRTDYITAGFGYREAHWFIDFAYVNKVLDETFYPYNSNSLSIAANPASVKTTNNNIVATIGFKF